MINNSVFTITDRNLIKESFHHFYKIIFCKQYMLASQVIELFKVDVTISFFVFLVSSIAFEITHFLNTLMIVSDRISDQLDNKQVVGSFTLLPAVYSLVPPIIHAV